MKKIFCILMSLSFVFPGLFVFAQEEYPNLEEIPNAECREIRTLNEMDSAAAATSQKPITPTMYEANSTGILSGWEGALGESSEVVWENWGYITESYDMRQQVEHFDIEATDDNRNIIVNFTNALKKSTGAKLVVGAKASADSTFKVNYAQEGDSYVEDNVSVAVSGGDTFQEYTIVDSGKTGWNELNDLKKLRLYLGAGEYTEARTLDIAYIRIVNASYDVGSQMPINSGAVEYNPADNIVDFDFGEALDESTVTSSAITINGEPVRWAMILPENPSRFRVGLGELRSGINYTVSFSNLMTESGYAVTNSDFTFTTSIPEAVDSELTIHKAAEPIGVMSGWEGALGESSEVTWENWGFITESYDTRLQVEHIDIQATDNDRNIIVNFTNALEKSAGAKLVIGVKASADSTFKVNYMQNGGSYVEDNVSVAVSGGDTFQEYTIVDSSKYGWNNLKDLKVLRLYLGSGEYTEARALDVAYIRVVDDSYNGPLGAEGDSITPEEFSNAFDAKNDSVFDLVFDKDIHLRDVSNENFTFNRNAADYVMVDRANPRRIRVSMKSSMTSFNRATLEVSGLYTADGAPINEKAIRFTTAEDVQTMLDELNRLRVEGTVAELQEMLEENYKWLYLKAEEYENFIAEGEHATELYRILLGSRAADKNELEYQLNEAAVLLKVRYSTMEEFLGAIERYHEYLQFQSLPTYTTYASVAEATQREAVSRLLAAQYDTMEELRDIFEESVILTALHRAITSGEARNILETNAELLDIDLSSAEGLKNPSAVYQALTERSFSSLTEVKQVYKDAADAQAEKEKSSGSGNGSNNTGGKKNGGGGSGAGGYVALPPQTEPAETTPGQEQSTTIRPTFSDMSGFDWAQTAVETLCAKGIVNGTGDGRFEPAREVRREEFVKMLAVAFELPLTADVEFADIAAGDWCAPYVGAAVRAGFVRGMGGIFGVGQTLRRQDAAVMAARALRMEESDGIVEFADSAEIADYARSAVNALAQAGILQGAEDGSFKPNGVLTRAEAAVILNRITGGASK